MTSTNHVSMTPPSPFFFNAQGMGIITSAIIHAACVLLLLLLPATHMIPRLQTIQINLEGREALSADNSGATGRKAVSRVDQVPDKITPKKVFKPMPVREKVFREDAVNAQLNTPKQFQGPVAADSRNSEVAASINAENLGAGKVKASIASNTESQGIVETRFGEMGAPAFIHREMPVYPIMARRLGKEGRVILKLLIDRSGKLQKVEVVEFAGFGFTEAAIAAVKNSTYLPASRNGEKITTKALIPIRFHLQ